MRRASTNERCTSVGRSPAPTVRAPSASSVAAVSKTIDQRAPDLAGQREHAVVGTGVEQQQERGRRRPSRPAGPGAAMPAPLRNRPRRGALAPVVVGHPPPIRRAEPPRVRQAGLRPRSSPVRKSRRWNTGCCLRSAMTASRTRTGGARARRCPSRARRSRSPGTSRCCCRPGCRRSRRRRAASACWERISVARKLRCCLLEDVDLRVVGLPLDAVVPGAVVVRPVAVVLEVGGVVLLVVGDEVAQGEAVRGDEVDARERPAAVVLVEVARASQAPGDSPPSASPRQRSRIVSR